MADNKTKHICQRVNSISNDPNSLFSMHSSKVSSNYSCKLLSIKKHLGAQRETTLSNLFAACGIPHLAFYTIVQLCQNNSLAVESLN